MFVKTPELKETVEASLAFLRETRNGMANIEQAKIGTSFVGRITTAVNVDLRVRLAAPRLREIEEASSAAA